MWEEEEEEGGETSRREDEMNRGEGGSLGESEGILILRGEEMEFGWLGGLKSFLWLR